uniref:Uncharacterized protein n=1 Tax=Trypanosoma congolense (strain IL3000) TaxID=1068625 RepID=G0UXM6_TRYCI|nr:conserved hypothetical protein [Trypanosoma congolense IL3000]
MVDDSFREKRLKQAYESKGAVTLCGVFPYDLPSLRPQTRRCEAAPPQHLLPCTYASVLAATDSPDRQVPRLRRSKTSRLRKRPVRKTMGTTESVNTDDELKSFLSSSAFMRHRRYNHPSTAYSLVTDPYDLQREVERQENFISSCKRLARPFITGGRNALNKPTRYMLGDCLTGLHRAVSRDWPEADPVVVSSAEDLIVVFINIKGVRSTLTVLRYMNSLLKRCEVVRTFDLKKVPEGWDVLTSDGHLMYTFRPPWVDQQHFLPSQVVVRKAH